MKCFSADSITSQTTYHSIDTSWKTCCGISTNTSRLIALMHPNLRSFRASLVMPLRA